MAIGNLEKLAKEAGNEHRESNLQPSRILPCERQAYLPPFLHQGRPGGVKEAEIYQQSISIIKRRMKLAIHITRYAVTGINAKEYI